MTKQTQNFTQLYIGLWIWAVACIALFFFSCNKKKEIPEVTIPTCKVTFDSKDGSVINVIKVKPGDTLSLPTNPTKKGAIFAGWYTDSQATATPFSTSATITSDITLYAKWNTFTLSSTSFTDGGKIPPKYACPTLNGQTDRLNVSPQLSWVNAPLATTSYLIIMEETEENCKKSSNSYLNCWVVYNIPADKNSLTANDLSIQENSTEYQGPCPPEGEKNTYQITIYALDLPADYYSNHNDNDNLLPSRLSPPTFIELAEHELKGHILASASIKATFKSKPIGQVNPLKRRKKR